MDIQYVQFHSYVKFEIKLQGYGDHIVIQIQVLDMVVVGLVVQQQE